MLKKFINFVNKIIPKKNIILFNSFPDISGNALMLYRYIVMHHQELLQKYKIIWTINQKDKLEARKTLDKFSDFRQYKIYKKKSISGIFQYCSSKYIITTHNYITGISTCGKQKHFNLWHGMPFKTIGKQIENSGSGDTIQADYTLATSNVFQDIMAKSFGISKEHVMITGQPCNDVLFSENNSLSRLNIDKEKYQTIILWMPTYRKSILGSIREDGDSTAFGVMQIVEQYFSEFIMLLKESNILMIIKPHPMDAINDLQVPTNDYIKILNNNDLDVAGVMLYELLAECDVLFTDYSSVVIDYLNLERPMAFVCADLQAYTANRGFFFEPITDYLPGEIITDYQQLKYYIKNIDVINDKWQEKRKSLNRLFNQYSDSLSSQRVYEYIFYHKS